jgi:SAM-dependent methyltransferase
MTGTVPDGEFGDKAPGFGDPTQLPQNEAERRAWQEANRAWWEGKPMRYDWRDELTSDKATADFFREIDRRFLSSVQKFLPCRATPFDALIPFDQLGTQDVLEIGVGHGSVAQFLALHARSYTGIDLTEEATGMTARRFTLLKRPGRILQMDAESMAFPDVSFDFIWSWGVIHHSADTTRILKEMHRVLRPGGRAVIMVYYRSWWAYYLFATLKLTLRGRVPTRKRIDLVRQQATDGAIARYYTRAEWEKLTSPLFATKTSVHGMSIELIPLPHSRLKDILLRILPDSIARFLTHNLAMGSFLVAHMTRK